MRMPRCTLKTMLLLVALAALCLGPPIELWRRADRYQRLAEHHRQEWLKALWAELGESPAESETGAGEPAAMIEERERDHLDLEDLYREAARRPWKPVPSLESYRRRRAEAVAPGRAAPAAPAAVCVNP